MEKARTSLWANFIDFINSFKNVKSSGEGRENLSDIPASYYEGRKVTGEQMAILKESAAKLDGEKTEKPKEKKKEKRNNFVQKNYNSGSAGGSQSKIVLNSSEVIAERPEDKTR